MKSSRLRPLSAPPASAVRNEPAQPPRENAHELAQALHEVSNALTVVTGWLEVARERAGAGSTREAIELASAYAELGRSIARRGIGAEDPSRDVERSASGLARAAVLGVTPSAEQKGVVIRFESRAGVDDIVKNGASVSQILLNLLLNAIAFSPEAGAVTLALREQDGMVHFEVTDEGPGVPPERASRIFESASSTRRGGAGIGLRHSKSLAESCGGALSLARTGPGASFELCWPLSDLKSGARHPMAPSHRLEGARILVLEDDPAVLGLIELALEARGAEVVRACSAKDLENIPAPELGFGAALLDLSPIVADPRAAVAAIRRVLGPLPIVLISGASGVPDVIEVEVRAWVRKPFEMGEVIDVLRELIDAR